MLKNNIVHSRMLLQQIKNDFTGVFVANGKYKINGDYVFKCPCSVDIDFSEAFGTSDKVTPSRYLIISGKLYLINGYNNLYEVQSVTGMLTGCTCVTGGGNQGNGYAIKSGMLYMLNGTNAPTQVGSANTWTLVSGDSAVNSSRYAYGIAGGSLYKIVGTTITKIGSSTKWTFIQGSYSSSQTPYTTAYGICDGKLYAIANTTATVIDTNTDWAEVRGVYNKGESVIDLGLKTTGELYAIKRYDRTPGSESIDIRQVGESNKWTDITPNFGICEGKLYYIRREPDVLKSGYPVEALQVGESNKWTYLTGVKAGSVGFAYGVCDGILYSLEEEEELTGNITKPKELNIRCCVGVYGSSDANNNITALCEVE